MCGDSVGGVCACIFRSFKQRAQSRVERAGPNWVGFCNGVGQKLACEDKEQEIACRSEESEKCQKGPNQAALAKDLGHAHGV